MGNLNPEPSQPEKPLKMPSEVDTEETLPRVDDEERDEFPPRPYPASIPHLHHSHAPPKTLGLMKGPSTPNNPLLLQIHPRFQSNLSGSCVAPPSTPQPGSAPPTFPTASSSHEHQDKPDARKFARSISDSTLRRAALHLNLTQSVLPSFISIQQFKVGFQTLIELSNQIKIPEV